MRKHQEKENSIKQSADKSKRHLPPRKLIICIKSLTLGAIHPLSDQVNQTFIKLRDLKKAWNLISPLEYPHQPWQAMGKVLEVE